MLVVVADLGWVLFDCLNSISCWVVNSVDVYRFFCFSFMVRGVSCRMMVLVCVGCCRVAWLLLYWWVGC